jgi:hypothetical protein
MVKPDFLRNRTPRFHRAINAVSDFTKSRMRANREYSRVSYVFMRRARQWRGRDSSRCCDGNSDGAMLLISQQPISSED